MSRNRVPAIALSALLAAGAFAPRMARGEIAPEVAPAEVTAPAEFAAVEMAPVAAEPAPPSVEKRKGNAFVRVITAPFRALGRLFGGGRKSASAESARKKAEQPAQVAAQVDAVKPAAPPTSAAAAPPAPAHQPAPTVAATTPPPAVAEQPAVKIVRPDDEARPAPPAGRWIPVIEGIGKDPLTQGRALLEHGYLREAIAELSAAASGTENLAEANNLLGLAYDRLGDHRAAAEAYQRALVVAPKDAVLLANLGYSLYLSNDFPGALKRLREASRLAPRLAVVHNNLGIVEARVGKYDDAFRSFARASNQYDAHLKLAAILDFERRDKQAVRHYEAALRLQPGTTAVLERLVTLYERTGDRTKAETARRTLGQPKNEQRTTTGGGG